MNPSLGPFDPPKRLPARVIKRWIPLLTLLLLPSLASAKFDIAAMLEGTIGASGIDFIITFGLIFSLALLALDKIFPTQRTTDLYSTRDETTPLFDKQAVIIAGLIGFSSAYYVLSNDIPFVDIIGAYGLLFALGLLVLLAMYALKSKNQKKGKPLCRILVISGIGLVILDNSLHGLIETITGYTGSATALGTLILTVAIILCMWKTIFAKKQGDTTVLPLSTIPSIPSTFPSPSTTSSPFTSTTPSGLPVTPANPSSSLKTRTSSTSSPALSQPRKRTKQLYQLNLRPGTLVGPTTTTPIKSRSVQIRQLPQQRIAYPTEITLSPNEYAVRPAVSRQSSSPRALPAPAQLALPAPKYASQYETNEVFGKMFGKEPYKLPWRNDQRAIHKAKGINENLSNKSIATQIINLESSLKASKTKIDRNFEYYEKWENKRE